CHDDHCPSPVSATMIQVVSAFAPEVRHAHPHPSRCSRHLHRRRTIVSSGARRNRPGQSACAAPHSATVITFPPPADVVRPWIAGRTAIPASIAVHGTRPVAGAEHALCEKYFAVHHLQRTFTS